MTTTDWPVHNGHTDHGAADSLGSGSAAPRLKPRGKPEWVKILEHDRTRATVAAHLLVHADDICATAAPTTPQEHVAHAAACMLIELAEALQEG